MLEAEWQKDLKAYDDCRQKHAAYVKWVTERDAAVTGKPLQEQKPKQKRRRKPAVAS